MSINRWTISGYGIEERVLLNADINKRVLFIKKYLPEVYEEMLTDINVNNPDEDFYISSEYFEACKDWIEECEDLNGNCGFGSVFTNAINKNEEEFEVSHEVSENEDAILYEDRAPWEMTDKVREMESEDMKAIFAKYLNDLGIEDFKFERQTVNYDGLFEG